VLSQQQHTRPRKIRHSAVAFESFGDILTTVAREKERSEIMVLNINLKTNGKHSSKRTASLANISHTRLAFLAHRPLEQMRA